MKQYNEVLKRNEKAENLLNNYDSLKAQNKLDKPLSFYVIAFTKLTTIISNKITELEMKLGREMTSKEVLQGFEI